MKVLKIFLLTTMANFHIAIVAMEVIFIIYMMAWTIATQQAQGRRNRSSWSGFGRTTTFQVKNKILFYKKQVINKSARAIGWFLDLLGLSRYSTVGRNAISRGGKLLVAHACDLFYAHKVLCCAKVSNR